MNKVLFLVNLPSPYRVDFFNCLGQSCDLTVVYENRRAADREEKWFSGETKYFKEIYLEKGKLSLSSAGTGLYRALREDYDFIVIGGYAQKDERNAILWLKAHRKPFLISADGGFANKEESLIKRTLKTKLVSSAAAWLSTGSGCTNYLVYYGAKRERTYEYPFTSLSQAELISSPPTRAKKNAVREKLGITEDNVVISVGQFISRKGMDLLISAATKLKTKNTGIYIIGGEPTEEYRTLVLANALTNVHFVSFLSKDELAQYYDAADVFVFPTRYDIWGLVVNEALSRALPVVSSDMALAALELIKDGENGYIFPSENVSAMAEAIDKALFKKRTLAANAIKNIKGYTIEKMAERHMEIFAELKDKKPFAKNKKKKEKME